MIIVLKRKSGILVLRKKQNKTKQKHVNENRPSSYIYSSQLKSDIMFQFVHYGTVVVLYGTRVLLFCSHRTTTKL